MASSVSRAGPVTPRRAASTAARPTIKKSLANSDGCSWNAPRLIQRRPPPTDVPTASTAAVLSSTMA